MPEHNEKNIDYCFLEDRPIQNENELLFFGHDELGKTLIDIVSNCRTPFTIGLFGKWGVGKSTLAYYIRRGLKAKNIPVVIFDVWKHEKDQILRRTFLKDLVLQLKKEYGKQANGEDIFEGGDDKFCVSDRIDSSIIKSNEGKFKINWDKIKQAKFIFFTFLLISLIFPTIFGGIFKSWDIFVQILSWEFSIIFTGSFLIWLLKNSTTFLSTETTTIGLDRFEDPAEFEDEFQRILRSMQNTYKRALIIFDNIDRVSSDRALEVLSTIKTFLEPSDELVKEKEVVFMVPCDAQALRAHIKSVYKTQENESYDPDEFLRKFFNSTILIPDFIPLELDQYTRKKLKETRISHFDADIISTLITTAFRDNPRQIIQFINILLSNYLLISGRLGENADFMPDFLEKNTPQLCRYLLLQILFPEVMSKLRKRNIFNLDSIDSQILQGIEKVEDFIDLLERTKNLAPLENIRLFYTLRRSKGEKQFPGITDFLVALEDEKPELAQRYLEGMQSFEAEKSTLFDLVKNYIVEIINPIIKVRFINTFLLCFSEYSKDFASKLNPIVYDIAIKMDITQTTNMDPVIWWESVIKFGPKWKANILDKWIKLVFDGDVLKTNVLNEKLLQKLVKIIISEIDGLSNEQLEKVRSGFVHEAYIKVWVLRLFVENAQIQDKLLSIDFVIKFIENLVKITNKEELIENNNLLSKIPTGLLNDNISSLLVNLVRAEVQTLNTLSEIKQKDELMFSLNTLVQSKVDIIKKVSDQNTWVQLLNTMISQLNTIGNWNDRKSMIILFIILWPIFPQSIRSQLQSNILNFLQVAELDSLKYALSNICIKDIFGENIFKNTIEKRAISDQKCFNLLYDELLKDEELRYNLLVKLVDADLNRGLLKIKEQCNDLPQKENVITGILDKFDSTDIKNKSEVIQICNLVKGINNDKIKDTILDKVRLLICSSDKQQQLVAQTELKEYEYLGDNRLRKLSVDIFDWIKQQGVSGKYFIIPIKFILDINKLIGKEKDELAYYLFQIIRTSNEQAELEVAFDSLSIINPEYEDHQQEFNDIKVRIEKKSNIAITNFIIKRLQDLMPKVTNKGNKEFWDWIKNLSVD